MSSPHLDNRIIRIVCWLLDQSGARSTAGLAADLGLSQRAVRYRLDAADRFLRSRGLSLVRRRGAGVWISASADEKAALRSELANVLAAPRVYARDERDHVVLAELLWSSPGPTSLDRLHATLEVSKASARRDLKRNEAWLDRRSLVLARKPGVGILVVGHETRIRQALVQLTLEAVPEPLLAELCSHPFLDAPLVRTRVPAGMHEHLAKLPINVAADLIESTGLRTMLAEGNSEMVFALYLAVTAARIERGAEVTLDAGQHRSLVDHPMAAAADAVAEAFAQAFHLTLTDQETAGITKYLLGLATLTTPEGREDHESLLDELAQIASEQLHGSLAMDAELRRSLSQHLDRLAVRLRYGLPIHNPLLDEVSTRYPDVHATAMDLGRLIAKHYDAPVTDAEVGFVTMYLAGALERSRLRPVRRAVIVCPSGMATAWLLVSRIQAEFPQLELVGVLSSRSYEELDARAVDIVISTIDIPLGAVPVVVVNPLLPHGDVRRLAEHL